MSSQASEYELDRMSHASEDGDDAKYQPARPEPAEASSSSRGVRFGDAGPPQVVNNPNPRPALAKRDLDRDPAARAQRIKYERSACALFVVVAIVGGSLLGASFQTVKRNHFGLLYSTTGRDIVDDDPYSPGRHFVGLSRDFHQLRSTHVNIGFTNDAERDNEKALEVRALDGQLISIELSFQYVIQPDNIRELYETFKDQYNEFYVNAVRAALRDVAASFSAESFFRERDVVESEMRAATERELNERFSDLVGFQLRQIILPDTLDNTLLRIQLEIQREKEAEERIQVTEVTTETSRVVREINTESANLQARLSQDTETQRLEIASNLTAVLEETNRLIETIRVGSSTDLEIFAERTETQRLALQSNLTVVEEVTVQLVNQIEIETNIEEADTDAGIALLDAETDAEALTLNRQARSTIRRKRDALKATFFGQLQSEVAMTPEEINVLLFVDAIEAHNPERIALDLYTPSSLMLPGQQALLEQQLGA